MGSIKSIDDIKREIEHRCDGPLSAFVFMGRACDLVARGCDADTVANALHDLLSDYGWLAGEDEQISTGS